MRGVPGMGCLIVAQAETIRVAKHRRAFRTARPILAGHVLVGRKSGAIRMRAGKNVVAIGLVADAIIYLTLLGERGLLGELIGAVQLRDVLGDNHAFGVHPRTFADAIARICCTGALRGQVSMPGLASRADRRGKFLAMPVGAGQSAKIGALAHADAGYKESHIRLLRSSWKRRQNGKACQQGYARSNSSHLNTFRHRERISHRNKNTGDVSLFRSSRSFSGQAPMYSPESGHWCRDVLFVPKADIEHL